MLVWSVTTVVVALLLVAQPMVDFLLHGPEHDDLGRGRPLTLEDLPSSLAFFVVLVGVPVALGASPAPRSDARSVPVPDVAGRRPRRPGG